MATIPDASHHLVTDFQDVLFVRVCAFLDGPAIDMGAVPPGADRRPELLKLRSLPEFSSIEEAIKVGGKEELMGSDSHSVR